MPIAAILSGIGKAAQASAGVSAIDGMFDGWLPQMKMTQSVTVQGAKGTSVRATLHMALATAFGMSVSRYGDKFVVRAEVDQVNNVAKVDMTLVSSTLASIIKKLTEGPAQPPPPKAPPKAPPKPVTATATGHSGSLTASGFFDDARKGDDTNVLAGIGGVIVNDSGGFGDFEDREDGYFGNPRNVLVNSPPEIVRGVRGGVVQTDQTVPWLLERTHSG